MRLARPLALSLIALGAALPCEASAAVTFLDVERSARALAQHSQTNFDLDGPISNGSTGSFSASPEADLTDTDGTRAFARVNFGSTITTERMTSNASFTQGVIPETDPDSFSRGDSHLEVDFQVTDDAIPFELTASQSGGSVTGVDVSLFKRVPGSGTQTVFSFRLPCCGAPALPIRGTLEPATYEFNVDAIVDVGGPHQNKSADGGHSVALLLGSQSPAVNITAGPSGTVTSDDAHFEFTTDVTPAPPGRFECRVDGSGDAAFTPCTSPVDLNDLAEGDHVFEVRYHPDGEEPGPVTQRSWTVQQSCEEAQAAATSPFEAASLEAPVPGGGPPRRVQPSPEVMVAQAPVPPARRPMARHPAPRPAPKAEVAAAALESAATRPRIRHVEPGSAIPGAAITIRGSGLGVRGTRVTIGGRVAKVLRARSTELRVLVPKARVGSQRLVVRRGRSSASARLRVLRPFRGTVRATPDTRRAKSATIGPAGGSVSATGADGTRYELAVPPGALAKDEPIGVAPIARFSGLPFTGTALGAELTPDGLTFATPATLTITARRALPRATVGFGYSNSTKVLEVQGPSGSGRVRVLQMPHFSSGAVAGTSPGDFANAVAPLLIEQPMRVDTVEQVKQLIGAYIQAFGIGFCETQPACGDAKSKALDSLRQRIQIRCDPQDTPTLGAVREIVNMEALRRQEPFEALDDISADCRARMLTQIVTPKLALVCGNNPAPLGRHSLIVNPSLDEGGPSDLDSDGELTHLEFLHFFPAVAAAAGETSIETEAKDCFSRGFDGLPSRGRELCATSRDAAEYELTRALAYAQRLGAGLQPYIDALDFCRIEVRVAAPAQPLAPGAGHQFAATIERVLDQDANGAVTWSAAGGSITESGLYTAPQEEGTYTVKATSVKNPTRSGTATVTVGQQQCPAG